MRVTNFLRTTSGNISQVKETAVSRRSSASTNVAECVELNRPVAHKKMPDFSNAVEAIVQRGLAIPFIKKISNSAVTLDWELESPPIIFHGTAVESTGALLSGQMIIHVKDETVEIQSFVATLTQHIFQKKPFHQHCDDCQNQYTELKSWQFITQPMTLHKGTHRFPFSTLLDGNLLASSNSKLIIVDYAFSAEAISRSLANLTPFTSKFKKPITVKRALPESEHTHQSVRLFPPTNIKGSADYYTVINPTGSNKVILKLDGLMSTRDEEVKNKTLDIWRLKRVSWKLEETITTIQPACDKHRPEDASEESMTKTQTRVLGEKHLHDGWKSDYSGPDGSVDLEFEYKINQGRSSKTREFKYACDSNTLNTKITHTLHIEMVVSKEYAPEGKPELSQPTGFGRCLRMAYDVAMTEHPGIGVSWDIETPPLYQDVPAAPPLYPEGPISYQELEMLLQQQTQRGTSSPPRRASVSSEFAE